MAEVLGFMHILVNKMCFRMELYLKELLESHLCAN